MTTYFISFGATLPGNNMGGVQVLKSGRIKQIIFCLGAIPAAADTANLQVEVSTQQTHQSQQSAALNTVPAITLINVRRVDTATQAVDRQVLGQCIVPCDFPIAALTFLAVNMAIIGTFTGSCSGNVMITVQD